MLNSIYLQDSAFMKFAMECLRENFDDHSPTILKVREDFKKKYNLVPKVPCAVIERKN